MAAMQIKSIPAEIRDVDTESGVVSGYFSTTGVWDDVGDMIMPGAYTKTIMERGAAGANRIKHLYMHEPFYPLGVPELSEDDLGLKFSTKISQTSFGKDVLKLYQDGVITEHSIGFDIPRGKSAVTGPEEDEPTVNGYPKRKIYEICLWEGSSVIWGANPLTPTTDVKSMDREARMLLVGRLAKQMASAESALKRSHLSTDEICEALEVALKAWQYQLDALRKSLEPEPVSTQDQEPQGLLEAFDSLTNLLRGSGFQ